MAATMQNQNRREFAQFCKYFTMRAVEVVVQSRLGGKIKTHCRNTQPRDWFNLNVDYVPEITEHLVRSLNNTFLPALDTINVLVSLRTADGDTLHLEIWKLSLDVQQVVSNVSCLRSQLYHRMSVMLRSILAASRVTPTYKLYTRRQSSDSFVLCYQIYSGSSDYQSILGDGYRAVELGFVGCSLGSIRVTLYCRTKMVIANDSFKQSRITRSIDENYFDFIVDMPPRYPATAAAELETYAKPIKMDAAANYGQRAEIGRVIGGVFTSPSKQQFAQPFPDLLLRELQPITVPSPSKATYCSPMPDFSPCFSNFSTSPGSADFNPCSPTIGRRASGNSVVAFQLGATSGSSSEDGGGGAPGGGQLANMSNAVVLRTAARGPLDLSSQRNSSAGVFPLDVSESSATSATSGGGSITWANNPKPSSMPDCVIRPHSPFKRDSFPFARLLASSCSAPAFNSTVEGGAAIGGAFPTSRRASQQVALLGATTCQQAIIEEEQQLHHQTSVNAAAVGSPRVAPIFTETEPAADLNLSDSHELTTSDGVRIYEKRKTSRCNDNNLKASSSSSSDDSFVHIEMAFAPSNKAVGDASAFLSQCKSAPQQLKSFESATAPATETVEFSAAGSSKSKSSPPVRQQNSNNSLLGQIPEQLRDFEQKMTVFDDFLKNLLTTEDESSDVES